MSVWPGTSWDQLHDVTTAGFSRTGLERVAAAARPLATTALMVVAGGRVVLQYGDVAEITYQASVRKSLLSLLYGSHVAAGRIRLDSTLAELDIDDVGGLRPDERGATVADLLTARSGVYHPAANPGGDEQNAPLRGSRAPGTHFLYNNWDFNVLGTIFAQQTGIGVFDAALTDLARPLGMQDFTPSRQRMLGVPERSRHLAYHFFLSCRDLARVGLLVLRGGEWAGHRIVPADWLARSTSVQADLGLAAPMDYGYLWWIPRPVRAEWAGASLAVGKFGQYLLMLPALDVVIAHVRAVPDEFAIARNQSRGTATAPVVDGVPLPDFVRLAGLVIAAQLIRCAPAVSRKRWTRRSNAARSRAPRGSLRVGHRNSSLEDLPDRGQVHGLPKDALVGDFTSLLIDD